MRITTEGVALTPRTAKKSRPSEDDPRFDSMDEVDDYFGSDPPRAREAEDKTRWCCRCDLTAPPGPNSAFCSTHHAERKKHTKKRRRALAAVTVPSSPGTGRCSGVNCQHGEVAVPVDKIRLIRERSEVMIAAVGLASANFQRMVNPPKWLDRLMLSAKELHRGITYGLPEVPPADGDSP